MLLKMQAPIQENWTNEMRPERCLGGQNGGQRQPETFEHIAQMAGTSCQTSETRKPLVFEHRHR